MLNRFEACRKWFFFYFIPKEIYANGVQKGKRIVFGILAHNLKPQNDEKKI